MGNVNKVFPCYNNPGEGSACMDNMKGIVQYQVAEYGHIQVKLADLLHDRGITRNRLRTLTGVKYEVIDRYYKGISIEMADLDFLAKVCFVLDCQVSDLLEYVPPHP